MTRINWNKLAKQDQLSRSNAAALRFERDHFAAPPADSEGSYPVRAKYTCRCSCGAQIDEGARGWYYPRNEAGNKLICEACGLIDSHGRVRSWKDRG